MEIINEIQSAEFATTETPAASTEETTKIKVERRKPSDEEINQYKDEFEASVVEFDAAIYSIGDVDNANKYADFLINFNTYQVSWSKNLWQGVIKMDEELLAAKNKLISGEEKEFKLTYHPLEYLYFVMSNPAGFGLQSAKTFQANLDLYSEIYAVIEKALTDVRAKLAKTHKAQERWQAAEQGFYLEDIGLEDQLEKEEPTV